MTAPCCVVIVAVGYLVAVYIIKSHASLIQNVVTCNMTSIAPWAQLESLQHIVPHHPDGNSGKRVEG